jgi:hypothetical protein
VVFIKLCILWKSVVPPEGPAGLFQYLFFDPSNEKHPFSYFQIAAYCPTEKGEKKTSRVPRA